MKECCACFVEGGGSVKEGVRGGIGLCFGASGMGGGEGGFGVGVPNNMGKRAGGGECVRACVLVFFVLLRGLVWVCDLLAFALVSEDTAVTRAPEFLSTLSTPEVLSGRAPRASPVSGCCQEQCARAKFKTRSRLR